MVQESRYCGEGLNFGSLIIVVSFHITSKWNNIIPTYESLAAQSKYFNGNLVQKMVDDLRLAGMAKRTFYGYLWAVRNLTDF